MIIFVRAMRLLCQNCRYSTNHYIISFSPVDRTKGVTNLFEKIKLQLTVETDFR